MGFLNLNREDRPRLDLDAIRAEHSLAGVVGAVVKLQRAGNELKACCPFHGEKTPSFSIYDGGKRYHCFGCGAGGDVLDFLMALHGVGLRDAASLLTAGSLPIVDVAVPPPEDKSEKIAEARAIWEQAKPITGRWPRRICVRVG